MGNRSMEPSSGIGITGVLTIVFIVLKLLGKITWSWVWVFSPLWIAAVVGIALWLIVSVIMFVAGRVARRRNK